MTAPGVRGDFEAQIKALRTPPRNVDPEEIAEVVASVMASIDGDRSSISLKLYNDIQALAAYIDNAKAGIAALRPDDISNKFLPTANDELGAVIQSTEQATNAIFEAVESIENATAGMDAATAQAVTDALTNIYEACGFQDITGQRISKVVTALQNIDVKVQALLEAFGESGASRPCAPEGVSDQPVGDLAGADQPGDELMNGPQLPDNAMNQDDVDALLASFD
jgi:chemotaxis protein CheZ